MKHHRIGLVRRRELKGLLFTLPWIIGFLVFFVWPLITSVSYSMYNIKFTAKGMRMAFVGADNYIRALLKDATFIAQFTSFWKESILNIIFILVFALVLALMLNTQLKGNGVFRTIFFLPVVLVSGPVLKRIINAGSMQVAEIAGIKVSDIINSTIPAVIAEPFQTFFSQIVLLLWYSGVPLLVFLTALQKIDKNQYQAALIDGASSWVAFWKITMPHLRPVIQISAFYSLVYLATSEMNSLISTIKNAMSGSYGYGMACAMALIYAASLILGMGVIALLCRERKGTTVENIKTREQIRVEKMHMSRARKGAKYGKG